MGYRVLLCGHCNTANAVGVCMQCNRPFVITAAHVKGELRAFEAEPITECPEDVRLLCDFCSAKQAKLTPTAVVHAGLRQNTCAHCHTEFLSQHGLLPI
jgi:hypothetical protein